MAISNLELKTAIYNLLTSLGKRQITLNDYILALKLSGKNQDLAKLQIDITKQIDSNLAKKYLLNKQIEQTHAKYLIAEADQESLNFQYTSVLQQQQRMDAAKNSAQVSIKNLNDNKNALTGLFNGDIKKINDSITKLNQELIALQNQIKDPNVSASTKIALKANANAKLITLDVEQGKLQIKTLERDQRIGLLNLQIAQHTDRIKLLDPQITSQKLIVGEYSKKIVDKTSEYNTLGTKEKGLIAELAAHEKKFSNLIIEKPQVAVDKLITIVELKQQQDLLIDRELDVNKERYFALEQVQSVTVSYVEVIVKNANTTTLATYNSFLENLTDKTKDLADIWQGNLAESVDYTQTIGLAQSKLTQEREKLNKYVEEKLADPDGKYYLAEIKLDEAAILRDYFAKRYDGLTQAETVTKGILELYKKQNQQATDLNNKIKPYLEFAKYTDNLVKIDSLEQQLINIKNSLVDPKPTDFKNIEHFLTANGKIGGIQVKYDALIKPYNDILAAKTKLLSSPAYLNAPLTDSFNITSPFPNTGYAVGFNNYNYLSGDFNGDGKTDLIHLATKSYTHTWISKGDGKFDIKSPFPTTGYGVELNNYKYLTGDFNGDGKTDLIHFATNSYTHTWLSKGDGTFDIKSPFPTVPYGVSANNYKYLTGDFNGDGKTDLIHFVNNDYTHTWISKGDGTFDIQSPFTPRTGYAIGMNNYNYQTGDFNGDGKIDLIHFVNNDAINVWFSKGDGTFEIKKQGGFTPWNGYAIGSNNYNYRVGDFNGDGKTDLIHFVDDKNINKWTSKGDGTFEITTPIANTGYGVSSNNYNYQTGDFNGDGKTDLVHFVNNNYVHILNSLGDSQTAQENKIDAQIAVVKQKVTQDLQALIDPVVDTLNPIINDKQQQALSTLGNFLSKDIKDFATASTQPLLKQYINDRLTLVNQIDSQIATATLPQREELQRQKATDLINLKLEITQLLQSPATASLFLIKYNQLSATDKQLKLKQLREESFPGSTENVDLNKLQQQIFTQQTNYQAEQDKLTKDIQAKQASANADLAQAQWYEDQAAIHWTASHKQGAVWIEKRQYKQRKLFGKKTKTLEVRHVDTNWIIWDAYTKQAAIERQQAKDTLAGVKSSTEAKTIVTTLLDSWTTAAKDAQNATSTKTEFQTYITKLETEKSTWINNNKAATLEKILPVISAEVAKAKAALDKANQTLTTEQAEYELSKKNYQTALDGVLDKKSLVDLQTHQVKLQLAAAEEWVNQELKGLDEEIQLTQRNKADLTKQIGIITEQLNTATLQKAELTSKKLLLEQSVQLITYQEAVLTKEKNNFTQKQSLITAQRNVINSEEKLLDKYLESPDKDYSNLEKELASARAALIEMQKLNQQALESSEKIADSLDKIQKDLLLQYDTKLAAVKDQQKIFLDLLTATKLQSNYTAEEAAQQGVLNKIQTDIITRLIEADRAGSAEAKELLKQASANNWATVAEIYARDYADIATDTGSKCSQGIAKPGDAALAKKYKEEAAKYRGLESQSKTQAANLKSLREKNQIQIDLLKGQELQAQRDLEVWSNKVAVTQQEIDKKQQELILAEVRIDVLGSMIEWTAQATNQLLTIEKLNYEQALLVQDLVAKRQLGIDQTVIARLEREQLQLGTQRKEILSQIEQINQVQTETALQSAINELRTDLGLGNISLVPNQTNQNKSLIELQQQLGELQKDPKLPTNIQTLLTQTKLDIGEVLKGKELATIQDNLLKATDALIKQNDQYQFQLAVFEQDEQNYRDIYTLVQSDLQAATAKLLSEIQKTGQLKTEESLLNAKNLENLYKLANGASAVAIATAIGKQPRELIEQIIEARIEDRVVRKKAFLNEVFGVFGTALKLVGTILSFTPLAPVGIGLTAAGGAIGAVQAAYNGNWASAIYQLATTILVAGTSYVSASLSSAKTSLATATNLKNAADITKYTNIVDSLGKTKLTFDVLNTSVSTIYGTYQAAKEGNGTLAFLTAINGVAKGFSTVAAATPLNASLQSLSKILNVANNLSSATAGAIGAFESGDIFGGLTYIGQAAGTISQNFAQDLEKNNLKVLSVFLKVTEKAPTAYKAIQAFKEGDWINGFGKTFETIKPLGEFFKSPANATNGQAPVPGTSTDIVGKAKGWIDTIESHLKNIDKTIKDATGLDHQGWINVAKTSVKVIALLKQDNIKGWIKGINGILDIWQKEGDSATLSKIQKVLDTADKLVDSYETGTLNGWLNGINDTLGIWQDDIRGFVETRRQKAVADRNFDTSKSLDDIKDPILKTTIENNRKFLTDINKLKALNLNPADSNLKDHFSFNPKTNQMYFLADTIDPNASNKFAAGKQVKLYIPITDLNNPPNIEKIKAQIKNGSPEIKLIIHGFQNSINSHWQEDLAEIEIKKNPNAIVIIADWGDMAGKSLLDYKYAAKNTNLVGDAIATKLSSLGIKDPSKITIIGHSLGAQVAANISESLQLAKLGKVAKIIALDPARPEFENSVFWWGDNSKNLDNRLDGLDATSVEIIHTSHDTAFPLGLGYKNDVADAQDDFVPKEVRNIYSGSDHHDAIDVFADYSKNKLPDQTFNAFIKQKQAQIAAQPKPTTPIVLSSLTIDLSELKGVKSFADLTLKQTIHNGEDYTWVYFKGQDPTKYLTITGVSPRQLSAANFNFIPKGTFANDTIIGDAGSNILDGGLGADKMTGGAGNDTYIVDNIGDIVSEKLNEGIDTVQSSLTHTLVLNVEKLTLTGTDAINGTGNILNNIMIGNSATNTLYGAGGSDSLTGGLGADKFLFKSKSEGIDTISDFTTGSDKIVISAAGFGAGLLTGMPINPNQWLKVSLGSAATNTSQRFVYNSTTGGLYFDADGSGVGGAVQFATLLNKANLTVTDFVVI